MVRAVLQNGEIRPLSPLPQDWQESQGLMIEVELEDSPEDISAWAKEIEEGAEAIPDEDHARFLESLAEQRLSSKQFVRHQMGLA